MSRPNQITVDDHGLITLPAESGGAVTLDAGRTDQLLASLNALTPDQLAALLQIAEIESDAIDPRFKTQLAGIAAKKNVVEGDISNVRMVRIGDERHYHYHLAHSPLPKELTSLIPAIDPQAGLKEKNIVRGGIARVKRIKIGDKEYAPGEPFDLKNIVGGSVKDADEFNLGDGH